LRLAPQGAAVRGKGAAHLLAVVLVVALLRAWDADVRRIRKEVAMPSRRLPRDPSLEHLKNEAKTLHRRVRAGDPDALALLREFHPRADELPEITLTDAQLTIARAYGFPSWPRLRAHVATAVRYSRSLRDDPLSAETDLAERFLP
jgi:hypothetical protein